MGSYPVVGLREARDLALEARKVLDGGKDPIEEKNRLVEEERRRLAIPTFEEAAYQVFDTVKAGFRNKGHTKQWILSLETYVFPVIGHLLVSNMRASDFARALKPIWLEIPETASRIKQRCDVVMKWCAANDFIIASPVSVVTQLLPRQPGKRERVAHQPAMPWQDVPAFIRDILHAGRPAQSKVMLEILILTGCRSGEVRGMRWNELDLTHGIWVIPAKRMKAKVAHRVPLTPYLRDLLRDQMPDTGPLGERLVLPNIVEAIFLVSEIYLG